MPRLTVLSGPSGVGKRTVITALRRSFPHVWVSVSATTRAPRPGETEGVDYHFVDRDEFAKLVDNGELLEHAEFAGNLYGTPRQPVLDHLAADVPTILEIELAGARQVRRSMPDARFVFLAPPSLDVLIQRLRDRGTETADAIAARLQHAQAELAAENEFDEVIVNNDVERAAHQLAALITEE
ncbi:MAG: guanylate kinase [Pseudonocardiales bacterium]|jgi:guanylate kinase|nr:guanylate kinase [Pseudonocardiales bacterium]MDT4922036.1 guanylate kinase [Pseudonocardiales bacterium]MDT4943145.1 guanylate kinase [Pseudonocardiales bacterium]